MNDDTSVSERAQALQQQKWLALHAPEHSLEAEQADAAVWQGITELAQQGEAGRAVLLGILNTPTSPLRFEVARVTLGFAPQETRRVLLEIAASESPWASHAQCVLDAAPGVDLNAFFPPRE